MIEEKPRVRFAPSPTGPLHVGGVRTALYNYLFARQHGGKMILRIEDTDRTRFVEGAEQYIIDALNWCGIDFDEGVHCGGDYGPYRQSERKVLYVKYIEKLIDSGKAYYAFDTPEELEEMRERGDGNQQYDASIRGKMKNSLTLSQQETDRLLSSKVPYVVRFMMPPERVVKINDVVRGKIEVDSSTLDDKVLLKADGMPTYHLANVVDDHLMKITHVIRGEEWLPSLPLHVLLYEAFGWRLPSFAHLPLLLKPEGKGKLSKRDGDRLGFPVFPTQWKDPQTGEIAMGFREEGYLPQAFVNILLRLGWNPGTDQEIFSMQEMIRTFNLEKVQKGGARFDPEKARWYNHQYIQQMDNETLAKEYLKILHRKGHDAPEEMALRITGMVKERINFPAEIWDQSWFLFEAPRELDPKVMKKKWKQDTPEIIRGLREQLAGAENFQPGALKEVVSDYIHSNGLGFGKVMVPLRICLVGKAAGPDLMEIMEIIGKEETLSRIDRALNP